MSEILRPGTKAYFRSLLRSEDLMTDDNAMIGVEWGWSEALNDLDERRRVKLPALWRAWEKMSDTYALGYITYVYGYTRVRMREEPESNAVQLAMFAEMAR